MKPRSLHEWYYFTMASNILDNVDDEEVQVRENSLSLFRCEGGQISELSSSMEYFVYPPFIENLHSQEFRAVVQVLAWQKLGEAVEDVLAEQKENPALRVVRAERGGYTCPALRRISRDKRCCAKAVSVEYKHIHFIFMHISSNIKSQMLVLPSFLRFFLLFFRNKAATRRQELSSRAASNTSSRGHRISRRYSNKNTKYAA